MEKSTNCVIEPRFHTKMRRSFERQQQNISGEASRIQQTLLAVPVYFSGGSTMRCRLDDLCDAQ